MKSAAAFLLLLLGGAIPQDSAKSESFSGERIRQLIEQLADDDVGRREDATAALQRAGERARKDLEEASRSSNQERAGRSDRLLSVLNRMRVFLMVQDVEHLSKEKPIPAEVLVRQVPGDAGTYFERGFNVTVWLLELHEEPPQEGRRIHGSFSGRSSTGCALSESDFLKLAPGSRHTIRIDDLRNHWGFQVSEKVVEKYPKISLEAPTVAGRYKVIATYDYDHAKYIGECKKGCPVHSKSESAWNQCFDKPLRAEAEFVIK